ncbi:hypothetical protein DFQ30_005469 [Apophysomyces sp. BC1015]|nr:hypothetical protein DFQ30_005469 [Apophysomyces sp. BC1015]
MDQLEQDVAPVLGAANPLAQGLDTGPQQGAGNVKAAVENAGAAVDQAANAVADVGANAAAGLDQTVGEAPKAVEGVVEALEHSGPIGSIINTIFGSSD